MTNQERQTPLSQIAYEQIKRKIVSLVLPPGAVIDESELRAELDLGRTPIREALKRLELERLVTILPRRGMFVTEISITDLPRLYEIRLPLECLVVRLAIKRGTADHWQKMQATIDQATAGDDIKPETLINIDETCHQIIYDAADNEFLRDTLATLYALNLRLWYLYFSQLQDQRNPIVEQKHIIEHQHILNALRNEDTEKAEKLMADHIRAYYDNIQAVMVGAQFVS